MASPPKPWEGNQDASSSSSSSSSSHASSSSTLESSPNQTSNFPASPPAPSLPNRPHAFPTSMAYPSTLSWNSYPSTSFSASSSSSSNPYYPVSNYSNMIGGGAYGRYPSSPYYASYPNAGASGWGGASSSLSAGGYYPPASMSSFASGSYAGSGPQPAPTQAALDVLQSFVHSIGSFAGMLDAVFHALMHSFQAITHVADQCKHFKHHLGHLFGLVFLFRQAKALLKRLCATFLPTQHTPPFIFVKDHHPWTDRFLHTTSTPSSSVNTRSWPYFLVSLPLFLTLLYVSKRRRRRRAHTDTLLPASTLKKDIEVARALYDYQAQSEYELSFRKGDLVAVLEKPFHHQPEGQLWWRGKVEKHEKVGFFPANYIEILHKSSHPTKATAVDATFSSVPHVP